MTRSTTPAEMQFLQDFLAMLAEPVRYSPRDYFRDPLYPEEAEFERKTRRPGGIATIEPSGDLGNALFGAMDI